MAVYRVEKTRDYTVMANYHLRDERLTLKAKGLLSLLLSLPDDWKITVRGLAAIVADGVDSVQAAMKELQDTGYISGEQKRGSHGKLAGWEYTIREAPYTEKPYTEKPYTGKPAQSSTNISSINNINNTIPPIAPQEGEDATACGRGSLPQSPPSAATAPPSGGAFASDPPEDGKARKKRERKAASWEPEMFERFWKCYPRGEDKQGAIAEWDRLKPDRDTMLAMSRALKIQMQSEEWLRGVGIPYAVRWLRHRRWEDEARGPIAPVSKEKELPVWN